MLRSRRELNADNVTKPREGSVGTAWGRTAWITPDGTTVVFLCFAEQLAANRQGRNDLLRGRFIAPDQVLRPQVDEAPCVTPCRFAPLVAIIARSRCSRSEECGS
jgi:hypothetical protein